VVFKITDYADRLLDDLAQLENLAGWSSVCVIGSAVPSAQVDFEIEGREEKVTVFTTVPTPCMARHSWWLRLSSWRLSL
jgi:leucyl-tRNA synthetase